MLHMGFEWTSKHWREKREFFGKPGLSATKALELGINRHDEIEFRIVHNAGYYDAVLELKQLRELRDYLDELIERKETASTASERH